MKKSNSKSGGTGSRTLFWAIAAFVCYLAALFFLKEFEYTNSLGYVVAFLPLLPFGAFLWHFIRDARHGDELEKQVQLEALAVAFPLCFLGAMCLGLLQLVSPLSPENWSYRHVVPFFFIFYLVGLVLAKRRYGIDGETQNTP
jgi:nicotinamide riboside transporter PnuC